MSKKSVRYIPMSYKKWITKRDNVLEKMLRNYRLQIAEILNHFFYDLIIYYMHTAQDATRLHYEMASSSIKINEIVNKMRKRVYILTITSESEILARLLNKQVNLHIRDSDIDINANFKSGGSVYHTTYMHLQTISDKLKNKVGFSRVQGKDLIIEDLIKCLPKKISYQYMRAALKKFKEVNQNIAGRNLSMDIVDDEEWNDILADYQDEFIPAGRGPDDFIKTRKYTSDYEDDGIYKWELERDITHDFVEQVRTGQIDAANQNGITDFVWISILDDKTDECCEWRDGLTTSEIEAELMDKHADDDCDETNPPAHFNCRCTIGPVTDELPDRPDNLGDFDTWLEN